MAKRRALIDYSKCLPGQCAPDDGICVAAAACSKKIMQQEEADEAPMILHVDVCQACGDCGQACPLNAITISEV